VGILRLKLYFWDTCQSIVFQGLAPFLFTTQTRIQKYTLVIIIYVCVCVAESRYGVMIAISRLRHDF